jgi:penicillin-binding protein 2
VVASDQIPAQFHQAVLDSFPGSGDATFPLDGDTWMTITDGMAAATTPGLYHTAEAAHLDGVDFAGKTGTAQVVGGGDTHTKGGSKTPNAWFVGMIPRRNPEIVIAVLQEHGDWGSGSALMAQRIAIAYVNKKRMQDHNVLDQAGSGKPLEMGAVWSDPSLPGRKNSGAGGTDSALHAGHFILRPQIAPAVQSAPAAAAKVLAASRVPLPAWLLASPLRFKEKQP